MSTPHADEPTLRIYSEPSVAVAVAVAPNGPEPAEADHQGLVIKEQPALPDSSPSDVGEAPPPAYNPNPNPNPNAPLAYQPQAGMYQQPMQPMQPIMYQQPVQGYPMAAAAYPQHQYSQQQPYVAVAVPFTYAQQSPIIRPSSTWFASNVIFVILFAILIGSFIITASSGKWLMFLTQIIMTTCVITCIIIWRYICHRGGEPSGSCDEPPRWNARTAFSLFNKFSLGFWAFGFGLVLIYVIEAMVMIFAITIHIDGNLETAGWIQISIFGLIFGATYYILLYIMCLSTSVSQALVASRTHLMNTVMAATGTSTTILYVAVTILAGVVQRFSTFNVSSEVDRESVRVVCIITFLLTITLIPLDMVCTEYMTLTYSMRKVAPAAPTRNVLWLPILMKTAYTIITYAMIYVWIEIDSWIGVVFIHLAIIYVCLILPVFAYVYHLRKRWLSAITTISATQPTTSPVQLQYVQVQVAHI